MVLPLVGTLEMEVAGHGGAVAKGKAALIAAGEDHAFAGSPHNRFLIMDLVPDTASSAAYRRARLFETASSSPFIALDETFGRLAGSLAQEISAYRLEGIDHDLAGELLLGALERRMGLSPLPADRRLARALALIERGLGEKMTVSGLARGIGVSEAGLHQLFRDSLGTSPGRYLAKRRMATAANLLAKPDVQISEVALAVGYSDQSAFTRAFTREFGRAPKAFQMEKIGR